jgi:cyclopropane fatty-acyl-phospholipid synthase-like methyltransferase
MNRIDTVGVHYSGTLWRWYRNWTGNFDEIKAKYGQRWYRVSVLLTLVIIQSFDQA